MNIIKTGICSYGMSGKLFHAPFIQNHPGYELTAIVERHNNDSRERYPQSKLYRSVDELIADDSIQLIIINTPTHLHFENAKAALLAGKNIVVEKPFTITVKEAEELTSLAKKQNLFLSIYQNRRYDGDYHAVKDVIEKKLLGELREVEIRYDRYRPVYGGKPHKEGNLPGAGIIYDLSPHLVDQALQLFGWPQALFADVWKMREDVVPPDYFEMLFYYPNLRVRLKATCICRETVPAYMLHGMKGSFLQQRSDLQEIQLTAGTVPSLESWCPPLSQPDGLLHTDINGEVIYSHLTSTPGNYMGYYDDLHKALTGKAPNPVPAGDGIKTIKIIEAALQSAAEKRIINLQ
ncbi:MAG TPA: Gfo/Idh/MocA family oxidoreductase [Chitinophagaceae bacterium]|jgi:predicted dehydrogenase|nr:Gfo/Idh/MocA family oxidoreductase [Chitinophagaceae bacterium]